MHVNRKLAELHNWAAIFPNCSAVRLGKSKDTYQDKFDSVKEYRKIPKISPGAHIFQRLFLRGLYSEGLIYGGKFVFQNRLG